jgi:hypothetical protein
MQPPVAHQPDRSQQSEEEEAENDDYRAADDVEFVTAGQENSAKRRRAGAQRDEDSRKTHYEADAQPRGGHSCCAFPVSRCGGACNIRNVPRNKRKHAG